MYRLKIESNNGIVTYHKCLTINDVASWIIQYQDIHKINIWYKVPKDQKK